MRYFPNGKVFDNSNREYKAGVRVRHEKYGTGVIIEMDLETFIVPAVIVQQDETCLLFSAFPEALAIC